MSGEWLDQEIVELQGAVAGDPGFYLRFVRDEGSGAYRAPGLSPGQEAFIEAAHKAARWSVFKERPGASEAEFEAGWPEQWRALRTPGSTPASTVYAVLDTGMMYEHPLLRDTVVGEANFSGEADAADHNGHGTIVALLYRAGMNMVPRYLNVKVANAAGAGKPRDLIAGLRWVADYKRAHPDVPVSANVSLGVYSRRWMLLDCTGTCPVCQAAIDAAEAGVTVAAAAGNTPGRTACPATAGLHRRHGRITAVEQLGWEGSGEGTVGVPGGEMWVPLE